MVDSESSTPGQASRAVPEWIEAAWEKSKPFTQLCDPPGSDIHELFVILVKCKQPDARSFDAPSVELISRLSTAADNLITALKLISENHAGWCSTTLARWIGEAVTKEHIEELGQYRSRPVDAGEPPPSAWSARMASQQACWAS
jgi:hypothetical protein